MVEKCSAFRLAMLICVACMAVSFLLYLAMLPGTSDSKPYGAKTSIALTEETTHSHGLYTKSTVVDELNESTYDLVLRSTAPTAILYYASWCGHCRHFVKPYTAMAEKLKTTFSTRQSGRKSARKKRSPMPRFAAIDCAEYSAICSKEEVHSYPTLVVYREGVSRGKVVGATEDKAVRLINEVFLSEKTTDVASTAPEEHIVDLPHPIWLRSYTASPRQRFTDGLASLDYMLANELPSKWTEEHRASLLEFITVVVSLFPSDTALASHRAVYETIIDVIRNDVSEPHKFLTDKIKAVVRDDPLHRTPQWQVCGRLTYPTSAVAAANLSTYGGHAAPVADAAPQLRGGRKFPAHRLRSHPRTLTATSGTSTSTPGSSVPTMAAAGSADESSIGGGYPCGLWFLFHYLTVSAADPRLSGKVTATQLLKSVYSLVRDFFGCMECRDHFLAAHDSCRFGACNITASDYSKLQMFFFHQHNAVTFLTRLPTTFTATEVSAVMWPSKDMCAQCYATSQDGGGGGSGAYGGAYDPAMFNSAAVETFLTQAYAITAN